MSYKVLSLKYRPQSFADLAGQNHVTTTLTDKIFFTRDPQLSRAQRHTNPWEFAKIQRRPLENALILSHHLLLSMHESNKTGWGIDISLRRVAV